MKSQFVWPPIHLNRLKNLHQDTCSNLIESIMNKHDQKIGRSEAILRPMLNGSEPFELAFEELDLSIQEMWKEIAVASFVTGYKLGTFHEYMNLNGAIKQDALH